MILFIEEKKGSEPNLFENINGILKSNIIGTVFNCARDAQPNKITPSKHQRLIQEAPQKITINKKPEQYLKRVSFASEKVLVYDSAVRMKLGKNGITLVLQGQNHC